MANEQRGIQSVEIAGQLLRTLAEAEEPLMLRDLASNAGMSASRAHPYLVSFMRIGLVEQDRTSSRYELGSLALQMGLARMRRLDPVRLATDIVDGMASEIGHTVALSVWGNHGPTVVWIEEGVGAVHVNMRVGSVMSLLGTATGLVYAAFLPPKMIEKFVDSGVGQQSVGDAAVGALSKKQIEEKIAEVRKRGLARAVELPIPGVNAFSVPVFDQSGSMALCITAIGPSGTFNVNWSSEVAKALIKRAQIISKELGFSPKAGQAKS